MRPRMACGSGISDLMSGLPSSKMFKRAIWSLPRYFGAFDKVVRAAASAGSSHFEMAPPA